MTFRFAFLTLTTLTLSSCSSLSRSIDEAKAFSQAHFKIIKAQNFKLSTHPLIALADKNHPQGDLSFDLWIEGQNPNPEPAALESLQWELLVDNHEWLRGSLSERVELAPQSAPTNFKLTVHAPLQQILNSSQGQNLAAIVMGFIANPSEAVTQLSVILHPTLKFGNWLAVQPSLTVTHKLTAQQLEAQTKKIQAILKP